MCAGPQAVSLLRALCDVHSLHPTVNKAQIPSNAWHCMKVAEHTDSFMVAFISAFVIQQTLCHDRASSAPQHANTPSAQYCLWVYCLALLKHVFLTASCALLQLHRGKDEGRASGGGSSCAEASGAELASCGTEGRREGLSCHPSQNCSVACDGPIQAQPGGAVAGRGLRRRQLSM